MMNVSTDSGAAVEATQQSSSGHTRRIKKAAVLGSGIMGSGIACHFANIGLEVVLLDIVPFDLKEEEKDNKKARNRLADTALKAATKAKINPLYDKNFVKRITTGNLTPPWR